MSTLIEKLEALLRRIETEPLWKVKEFEAANKFADMLRVLLAGHAKEGQRIRQDLEFVRNDLLDLGERVTDPILRLFAGRSVNKLDDMLARDGPFASLPVPDALREALERTANLIASRNYILAESEARAALAPRKEGE